MPEVIGTDTEGREVLRWVEGSPGGDPLTGSVSVQVQSDDVLSTTARLIRTYHDVSANFRWAAGGWQQLLRDPSGEDEIVCHNDLSYFNIVFRGGEPSALVDWEFAAPGSRLWDLAYAAWWMVPLHRPECCERLGWRPVDQPSRLRLFCDAYGLGQERKHLLERIRLRQLANQRQLQHWAQVGIIPPYDPDDPRIECGKTDYVEERKREFEAALLG